MRNVFGVVSGLVVGAALVMRVGGAMAQSDPPRSASVLHMQGKARASSDHATWHKLANGSLLMPGALIQTGENSILDIVLAKPIMGSAASAVPDKQDAGMVRLAGNSVLGIDRLSSERAGDDLVEDIELDLQAGEMSGVAGKPAAGSKYEIKFAKGVAGIRGAAYRMTAGGFVSVKAGEVVVVMALADGSTVVKVVSAGHQFDPGTGIVNEISSAPANDVPMPATPPKSEPAPASNSSRPPEMRPAGSLRPLRPF